MKQYKIIVSGDCLNFEAVVTEKRLESKLKSIRGTIEVIIEEKRIAITKEEGYYPAKRNRVRREKKRHWVFNAYKYGLPQHKINIQPL